MEGLIGASVVARLIFMYRNRDLYSHSDESRLIEVAYGTSCNKNVPAPGVFDETCQGCVPLAFLICSESDGFEEAIRRAVLYGGDSDTLAAIVGSLAEARWGIPHDIKEKALELLPHDMRSVINLFSKKYGYDYGRRR